MQDIERLDGVEIKLRFPPDTNHQIVQHPARPFWFGTLRSTQQTVVAVFLDRGDTGTLEVFLTPSQIRHALDSVARQEDPVFDTILQPEDLVPNRSF